MSAAVRALVLLALLGAPSGARAQDADDEAPVPAPKEMRVQRVAGDGIGVDGRLDEAAWAQATFHSDFVQKGPGSGFTPRARTEVALLQDDEALYVAARMEGEPGEVARPLLDRRDEAGDTERILLSLDSYRSRTTAFTFGVTVGGVRLDYVTVQDRESARDETYDPLWTARVARDSAGWSAEMRIPFSQLRYTPGDEQSWGLNVQRWNPTSGLNVYWVMVPFEESGWVSRFGFLDGIDVRSAAPRLELVPYARGRVTMLDPALGGGPEPETQYRAGADLKLLVRPNLTLDATLNPDFGQVEADPARINLTAFETFFPERRPFFLEGQALFRPRGPNWFYSRRIGALPSVGGRFERVDNARVLGGAKLTGRLESGLSMGALAALTDRERVPGEVEGTQREVAPRTAFGVVRLQQELGSAGSSIGGIVTAVERAFDPNDPLLAERLPRRALAGGVDWVLRFGDGAFELNGFGGGSYVAGRTEAMRRVQLSSPHYFQRPDATHVGVDDAADLLTGWTAGLGIGQIGGEHWRWSLDASAVSPGFEIRDAGTQARADRIDADAAVSYLMRDGRGVARNRRFGVGVSSRWNFAGDHVRLMPSAFFSMGWGRVASTSVEAGVTLPTLSDDLTRGGPLMTAPGSLWGRFEVASARSDRGWWSVDLSGTLDDADGWSATAGVGAGLAVARWLELSVYGSGILADDARQYITSVAGGRPETFGRRYVFSELERRELLAQLRAKIALAPDAVLTLYAEPFVSSGRAHHFGELAAPRSEVVLRYRADGVIERAEDGARLVTWRGETFRIENFDYSARSFRGTGVFRWEWRGSTLFLIWQKSLWNVGERWTGVVPEDLVDALDDPGQDMAVVKLSVRFGGR